MPNVADELAALRAKGSVKSHASNLAKGGGAALSTPEAETAAIKAKKDLEKKGSIHAKEILNKGSHSAAQAEAEQAAQFTAQKRDDWEKKAQATANLNKGGSGYGKDMEHAVKQSGKKREERSKKEETKKAMASQARTKESSTKTKAPEAKTETKEPAAAPAAAVQKEAPAPQAPASTSTPVVEDVEDDVPDLEEAADAVVPDLETPTSSTNATQQQPQMGQPQEEEERQITNRNEKKARKMMTRLGMRPVPHIARATLKPAGGRGYFFIDRPEVFVSVGGKNDTYVMFGEARQGGGGAAQQQAAQVQAVAQRRAAMAAANATAASAGGMPSVEEAEENVPEVAEEAGGDEEGVEGKDVELVMSQANCSRSKAVGALKENDGDLVNAIMSLTT